MLLEQLIHKSYMSCIRYYPETKEKANNIKGYVAFYKASAHYLALSIFLLTEETYSQGKDNITVS